MRAGVRNLEQLHGSGRLFDGRLVVVIPAGKRIPARNHHPADQLCARKPWPLLYGEGQNRNIPATLNTGLPRANDFFLPQPRNDALYQMPFGLRRFKGRTPNIAVTATTLHRRFPRVYHNVTLQHARAERRWNGS